MSFLQRHFRLLLLFFVTSACVESYDPPVDNTDVNFLVVEAFLDASDGSVHVNLTRTLPVTSNETVPVEAGAFVSIEVEGGSTYQLDETAPGVYSGMVFEISFDTQYRLQIQTQDEEVYTSDFIHLKDTPPLGDIDYSMVRDGLQLTVSTNDMSGLSNYYRWKFWETYEYTSNYNSAYMFLGDTIDLRPADRNIHTCWRTLPSTDIFVASTKSLTESVVSNFPLIIIPRGSIKVMRKYSLLVQQQALSAEAYNYWLNLQKTTERLGGLFDPLPYEVKGNIHCTTDPQKPVIGFFSGSLLQEKRIFIDAYDLPSEMRTYQRPYCPVDTLLIEDLHTVTESTLLIEAVIIDVQGLIGYTLSTRPCIDCTMGGGVTQKPDFWE